MKAYLDQKLIYAVEKYIDETQKNPLAEVCQNAGLIKEAEDLEVILNWPALFEYLSYEQIYDTLPNFEDLQIYRLLISYLSSNEKEIQYYLYDQVFVECLTQVKSLPIVNQSFLIHLIEKKKSLPKFAYEKELFSNSLNWYEKKLKEDPYRLLHDLTLYLAWDRVCISLAVVFEQVLPHPQNINGLNILKECLIESFQHITRDGKTTPGFFRLIEALYAFYMREENLENHSEEDWTILCQSADALRPREILINIPYIDAAIDETKEKDDNPAAPVKVFTLCREEYAAATLSFAKFMINKLKSEGEWGFSLYPVEMIFLKVAESGFAMS